MSSLIHFELFGIPILQFLFHDHLPQTITILLLVTGFLSTVINRLLDFVRTRRAPLALKEKLFEASEIYIRPDFSFSDPAHYLEPGEIQDRERDLLSHIEKALETRSDRSRYIVLAGSGMGKSALLFNLYNRHLRKIARKYKMHLIELGTKNSLRNIEDIEEQENSILLLDALDENADAIDDMESTIRLISERTQKFFRVVITCRTQFFNRIEEIPEILTNVGGVAGAGEQKKGAYEKLFLCPFTHRQIELYLLRKYVFKIRGFSIFKYYKALQTFKKVPQLSVRPMLLSQRCPVDQAWVATNRRCLSISWGHSRRRRVVCLFRHPSQGSADRPASGN